jgi:hypothetical protein
MWFETGLRQAQSLLTKSGWFRFAADRYSQVFTSNFDTEDRINAPDSAGLPGMKGLISRAASKAPLILVGSY